MKRQQLLGSFALASTTAVLATQPVRAENVQVTAVRLNPTDSGIEIILESPSSKAARVFTSSSGDNFIAKIFNTQLRLPKGKTFHASNPTAGITDVTVKPLNTNGIQVTITGKANAPAGQLFQSDKGLVFSLKTNQASEKPLLISSSKTEQLRVESTKVAQQPQDAAEPVEGNQNPQTAPPTAPAPTPSATPTPTTPGTDVRAPITPAPDYLNPSPNPLKFPTKPEEVQVVGAQPITLQQAIDLALRNNRQLEVQRLQLEASQAALRVARADLYPQLSLGSQLNNTNNVFSSEINSPLIRQTGSEGSATSGNANLSLSYRLYTSGLRPANIRAAEEQLRFSRLDVEVTSEDVRLNVASTYYNLQQADENVRIQQSAVANSRASLRDAQALEQAGVGTRFDVLQAQVQLAQATQDLTNALSQQRIQRRQLTALLSLPESIIVTAAEPVEIAGLWNPTLPETIVLAYQSRAELRQQLARRNFNEQQRRAALSAVEPQVSLSASYNYNDVFNEGTGDFGDDYRLGANLSWLLYDGGEARARARQQEANKRSAEAQFAQQRDQIRLDVEEAYFQLQSNFENIQTTTVAVEQAREALRLARLRFQAGVGTQTDVIQAEDDLTASEGARVNAILSYNRALASLQRAVSSGVPQGAPLTQ